MKRVLTTLALTVALATSSAGIAQAATQYYGPYSTESKCKSAAATREFYGAQNVSRCFYDTGGWYFYTW